MSGLFASRGPVGEPWFRIGRLEVGTVMFVVLLVVGSWVAWVFNPALPLVLGYSPSALGSGEVWRLVTWPLANELGLWEVLGVFLFWYFGTELEQQIGRRQTVWLLAGIWASLTAASTVAGLLLTDQWLAGIGLVQFVILLLWIAEYPSRPFFFGIPAWVVGVVLVGVQALGMVAYRALGNLVSLLLSLVLVAFVARMVGLLTSYPWIPGGRTPAPRTRTRAPRMTRADVKEQRRRMTDREQLDAILDQINERGLGSLSAAQRRELTRLRDRLRRG